MSVRAIGIVILAGLLTAGGASARTWRIEPDGDGDAPTIQAGIDSAAVGDTVDLACGTYYETNLAMKSGIVLRSRTGHASCAVIDGGGLGRVLSCEDIDESARMIGITFTGGFASGDWPDHCGGGMICFSSSPVVSSCVFESNLASTGGAVACFESSSPLFAGCSFRANESSYHGGGVMCRYSSSPTFVDCGFEENVSDDDGGGFFGTDDSAPRFTACSFTNNTAIQGGGLYVDDSETMLELIDCTLTGNEAIHGGGAYVVAVSSRFTRCSFEGNRAIFEAGGILCGPPDADFDECLFTGNQAQHGGGLYAVETNVSVSHSTFYADSAAAGGEVYLTVPGTSVTLTHSILAFGKSGSAVYCDPGSMPEALLSCTDVYANVGGDWTQCIEGQEGTSGNFTADPLFCDPGGGDLRLESGSPCLTPEGCGPIGAFGQGCVTTSVPAGRRDATSWSAVKKRFR